LSAIDGGVRQASVSASLEVSPFPESAFFVTMRALSDFDWNPRDRGLQYPGWNMRRGKFLHALQGVTGCPPAKRVQGPFAKYALNQLLLVIALGVPAPSAWAQQPVTAADLVGTVMKVSVTNDRILRRDGRQIPNRYQTDWTIEFVSQVFIRPTFVGTSYKPRGTSKTPLEGGGLIHLGVPKETRSRGGGDEIWIFDPGVLTFLRTYEGGAMNATFAVTRTDAGFACTAKVSWPKETGVPTIVLRSFEDNSKIEIISAKQSASSCTMSKPTSGEGQKP
jgi:hypothetical protein